MKRIRGRRVALLLASALPLVAENNDLDDSADTSAVSSATKTDPPTAKDVAFVSTFATMLLSPDDDLSYQANSSQQEDGTTRTDAHDSAEASSSSSVQPYQSPLHVRDLRDDERDYEGHYSGHERESSTLWGKENAEWGACSSYYDFETLPEGLSCPDLPQYDSSESDLSFSASSLSLAVRPPYCPSIAGNHMARCCQWQYDFWRLLETSSNQSLVKDHFVAPPRLSEIQLTSETIYDDSEPVDTESATDVAIETNTTSSTLKTEGEESIVQKAEGAQQPDEAVDTKVNYAVDYASKSAGGLVIESSPNLQGASNLLTSDKDRYALVACDEPTKYIVIGLSEDILVKRIVLGAYERFSAHVHRFRVLGTTSLNSNKPYVDLGVYEALPLYQGGKQEFDLHTPMWARYIRVQFEEFYGDEHICTISQIKVHGSTVLQGFHEQWEEDETETVKAEADGDKDGEEGDGTSPDDIGIDRESDEDDDDDLELPADNLSNMSSKKRQNIVRGLDFITLLRRYKSRFNSNPSWSRALAASSSRMTSNDLQQQYHMSVSTSATPNTVALSDYASRCDDSADDVKRCHRRSQSFVGSRKNDTAIGKRNLDLGTPTIFSGLEHWTTGIIGRLIRTHSFPLDNDELSPERERAGESGGSEGAGAILDGAAGARTEKYDEESSMAITLDGSDALSATVDALTETGTDTRSVTTSDVRHSQAIRETSMVLARLLERLPSAGCLKELDFDVFRLDMVKDKVGASGQGSQTPLGGAVEPIFKRLTDEIKSLQTSVSVHDKFTSLSIACYQRVLFDLVVEMESARKEQDIRLRKLELELSGSVTGWIISTRAMFAPILAWAMSTLWCILLVIVANDYGSFVNWVRIVAGSIAAVILSIKLYEKYKQSVPTEKDRLSVVEPPGLRASSMGEDQDESSPQDTSTSPSSLSASSPQEKAVESCESSFDSSVSSAQLQGVSPLIVSAAKNPVSVPPLAEEGPKNPESAPQSLEEGSKNPVSATQLLEEAPPRRLSGDERSKSC